MKLRYYIEKIQINCLRNLQNVNLELGPKFNVLTGENGSGKTSLLEAIYLLGTGKSFRSTQLCSIVNFDEQQCRIKAKLTQENLAGSIDLLFDRHKDGKKIVQIGGKAGCKAVEFARYLPTLVLNADSMNLVVGGPSERRKFLDWGMFHVEPQAATSWQLMQRALQQRNACLYQGCSPSILEHWTYQFVTHAHVVDKARKCFFARVLDYWEILLSEYFVIKLDTQYYAGWPQDIDLLIVLTNSIQQEKQQKTTLFGPHRADFQVKTTNMLWKQVLSRGQAKLAVALLYLAGVYAVKSLAVDQWNPVILIDDFQAELDDKAYAKFIAELTKLTGQIILTGVHRHKVATLAKVDCKWFHVEHGVIKVDNKQQTVGA